MSLTKETANVIDNMSFDSVNNRMLYQFRNKEKITNFLKSVCNQEDDLTNAQVKIYNKLNIDNATGFQLDQIGGIIGQDRYISNIYKEKFFGFTGMYNTATFEDARFRNSDDSDGEYLIMADDFYRKVLKARILKNNSDCNPDDTIKSLMYAFDCTKANFENAGNAKINIYISKVLTSQDCLIAKSLDLIIIAAGIGIKSIYVAPETFFGFTDISGSTGFSQSGFYESYLLGNSYGIAQTDGDNYVPKYFGFYGQTDAGGFDLKFSE